MTVFNRDRLVQAFQNLRDVEVANQLADNMSGSAAALTTQLTTITASAPSEADYAIADLTTDTAYGFVSADEGQTVLSVIANLQTRVAELEARLQAAGIVG